MRRRCRRGCFACRTEASGYDGAPVGRPLRGRLPPAVVESLQDRVAGGHRPHQGEELIDPAAVPLRRRPGRAIDRQHHLVATVDSLERPSRQRHIGRDVREDDGLDAFDSKDGVEVGAVEGGQAGHPRDDDVSIVDGQARCERRRLRAHGETAAGEQRRQRAVPSFSDPVRPGSDQRPHDENSRIAPRPHQTVDPFDDVTGRNMRREPRGAGSARDRRCRTASRRR